MIIVPIGGDYTCPHCNTVTSHYATKLQCDCHRNSGQGINFGGILHLPADADATATDEDVAQDIHDSKQKGTQP